MSATPRPEDGRVSASTTRANTWLIAAFSLLLALALILRTALAGYPLNTPGYDGGVYYGTAALLLRGVVPYHDYVFLQPPGSTLLLTPFAALGAATSSSFGLLAAHYFVVAVAVANVILLGILLRRRSPFALAAGLAVAAFYGDAVVADGTVLLEPLIALAALIALALVIRDETLISSPRAWLGAGVALGIGTSIKLWGVAVLLVLLVPALLRGRRVAVPYVAGFVGVVAALCLPFLALAPVPFWREVVTDQATRTSSGGASLVARVANLADAYSGSGRHHLDLGFLVAVLSLVAIVLVVLVVALRVLRAPGGERRRMAALSDLDVVALVALVLIVLSFLVARQYYAHYGGFVAPFAGVVVSSVTLRALREWRRAASFGATLLAVVLCVSAFTHLVPRRSSADVPRTLEHVIPAHACVASWNPAATILANRFSAGENGCPVILDVYGTELAEDNGYGESVVDTRSVRVQDQILAWWRRSDAVVLTQAPGATHDLGPAVRRYLREEFPVVRRTRGWYVFLRSSS